MLFKVPGSPFLLPPHFLSQPLTLHPCPPSRSPLPSMPHSSLGSVFLDIPGVPRCQAGHIFTCCPPRASPFACTGITGTSTAAHALGLHSSWNVLLCWGGAVPPLARKMQWVSSTIQDTSQILWAGSCWCPVQNLTVLFPSPTRARCPGEAAPRPSPEREPVLLNVYFPPCNKERVKSQALI